MKRYPQVWSKSLGHQATLAVDWPNACCYTVGVTALGDDIICTMPIDMVHDSLSFDWKGKHFRCERLLLRCSAHANPAISYPIAWIGDDSYVSAY